MARKARRKDSPVQAQAYLIQSDMFVLGFCLFVLPYFLASFVLLRKKVLRHAANAVSFSVLLFLQFIFAFLVVQDRTPGNILQHIARPTLKFYTQYYALIFALSATAYLALPFLQKRVRRSKKFKALIFALLLLAVFNVSALLWALNHFPIEQPRTVFYVLQSPVEGGVNARTVLSAAVCILTPLLVCIAAYAAGPKVLALRERRRGPVAEPAEAKAVATLFLAGMFAMSVAAVFFRARLWEYPALMAAASEPPVKSEFYEKEFVPPESVGIEFPEEKRNLIVIFLESMESSYADRASGGLLDENLIPRLTSLAAKNVNFSNTEYMGGV